MKLKYILFLFILSLGLASCTKESIEPIGPADRTILVYLLANNSLANNGFDTANIEDMQKVANAKNLNGGNLIVYWVPKGRKPQLLQIKENSKGVVTQNLIREYETANSADPDVMQSVIRDVVSRFPANEYGLILWSHGSAWIPSDYANMLKSFGQDGSNWLEIDELAKGIPDNLFKFILFDACYMASIECVYELKDKAEYIIGSPTETMGAGWPYQLITPYFFTQNLQLEKIAELFYNYYNGQSGDYRTATVSVVKTDELDVLAGIVRDILSNKSKTDIYAADLSQMQKLEFLSKNNYSVSPCLLYDFDDFIKQLATADQYARFRESMKKLITYEAHTETAYFAALYRSYTIERCSGLTVYAPQENLLKINNWYEKRLKWFPAVYK